MTVRVTDATQRTALAAGHIAHVHFVELLLSAPLRLSSLPYNFNWDGHAWLGTGALGSISAIDENMDLQAKGVTMSLAGLDSSVIASALAEHYQGKSCKIWFCPMNVNGQLVGTPIRIFKGRLDTMDIEDGDKSTINVNAESKLIDFFRLRVSRYNDADQQKRYPGDRGLEYAEQMVEKEITWGFS